MPHPNIKIVPEEVPAQQETTILTDVLQSAQHAEETLEIQLEDAGVLGTYPAQEFSTTTTNDPKAVLDLPAHEPIMAPNEPGGSTRRESERFLLRL